MHIGTVQYGKGSLYGHAISGTQSPKAKWRVPRQEGRPRVLRRFRYLLGEHWKFSSRYFCFLCEVKPRLPAEQGLFFLTCNVSKMDDKKCFPQEVISAMTCCVSEKLCVFCTVLPCSGGPE